jgi:predicted nucleic acid-binding protein
MRLVVDTSVMVAAIRSDTGASRYLLVAALEGRFTMLVSVPLLMEYQAVMSATGAPRGLTLVAIGYRSSA